MARKKVTEKAPAATNPGAEVYRLKITLADIQPPVWREVEVPDMTLAKLHRVIQAVMPWQDYHLWSFAAGGENYGPETDDELEWLPASKVRLAQLVGAGVRKFVYTYDYGDDWRHVIQVRKALPPEEGVRYPRCVGGERACPPEDCGGPWGYADLLEALADPAHEGHADLLEWVGGVFDPEAFDAEKASQAVRKVR